MKKIIFLVLMSISFLFSCQRATENSSTQISIQLPGNNSQSISQIISQSTQVTTLSDINLNDEGNDENFLSDLPTGFTASGARPINCYLIAVSGPEAQFQRNSCYKDGAVAGTVNSSYYAFGPYLGLKPAGSVIEMDVAPGPDREVLIFGLHAVDIATCNDLKINKPSKTNFTKPHLLGRSAKMRFEPGKTLTIPIQMVEPVVANQVDDCKMDDDEGPRIADFIGIENRSFPQNILRKPISVGSACEPIDVVLKSGGQYGSGGVTTTAVTAELKSTVSGVTTTRNTYVDYSACITSGDIGSATFSIPAGSSFRRVWAKFVSGDNASGDFSVAAANLNTASSHFDLITSSTVYKFDLITPRAVKPNQCHEVRVNYRTVAGALSADISSQDFTISTNSGPNTSNIATFYYDASCTSPSAGGSFLIPGLNHGITVYLKLNSTVPSDLKSFGINVNQTSNNVKPAGTGISINPDTAAIPFIANMRLNFKNYFKNDICIPITVDFYDQAGQLILPNATDQITVNHSGADMNYIQLYADQSCTSAIYDNEFAYALDGSAVRQFSIRAVSGSTSGLKNFSFKFNNRFSKTFYFNLQDSNY